MIMDVYYIGGFLNIGRWEWELRMIIRWIVYFNRTWIDVWLDSFG